MVQKNARVLTQIEGQHSVAAELCALGYLPTILPERTFTGDLVALSPTGNALVIEVKTNRQRNGWFCKRPTGDSPAQIWVFVELQPKRTFYVLTREEVQEECDAYKREKSRKPTDEGFKAAQLDKYQGAWGKLCPPN